MAVALSLMAQPPLPLVPSEQAAKMVAKHKWEWTVTDDNGKPLSDVLLVKPYLFVRKGPKWSELLSNRLGCPTDPEPLRKALENMVINDIERYEVMGESRHLPLFGGNWAWNDSNGGQITGFCPTLETDFNDIGFFAIIFKPGYYPSVIFGDYTEALRTNKWESRVMLKAWPERQATLAKRPWVFENIALQKEVCKHWQGRNPGGKPLFVKDPFPGWEERIRGMRDRALSAGFKKDAAWLELALTYTTRRTEGGYDNSGEEDDLRNGRCYQAWERAAELAPDITIICARRDLRRFILSSPMGVIEKKEFFSGRPECRFDSFAIWTREGLDQLYKTLAPFENDPLLVLRLTDALKSRGLFKSPKPIKDEFFRYRLKLWGKLLKHYPSALWFTSADEWFDQYEFETNGIYPLEYGISSVTGNEKR